MLDAKAILSEITAEIDYARNEVETTLDRRDAHMWAKGYLKSAQRCREIVQDHLTIDLRDAPAEPSDPLHYGPHRDPHS